jgi:VWFA-related protein
VAVIHRAIAAALLVSAATGAQEPRFRISVDLVQVDAVVTDSKGKHVRDLEAADFQITEDGRPQKITHFARIDGGTVRAAESAPGTSPRNPARGEVGRSIVLMFDDSYSHADEDLVQVFPAVRNFITGQLGPRDLAAVTPAAAAWASTSNSPTINSDFSMPSTASHTGPDSACGRWTFR